MSLKEEKMNKIIKNFIDQQYNLFSCQREAEVTLQTKV